jgi:hypothetical protein
MKRNKMRGAVSKIMNFLCALIIMFIVLFAIGAFIEADFRTRSIAGNHTTALFSYVRHEENNTAVFKAFGESLTVSFDRLDYAMDRFSHISAVNRSYAPSFIILSGAIIRSCLSSVSGWLMRLPGIAAYFFNPENPADPVDFADSIDSADSVEFMDSTG